MTTVYANKNKLARQIVAKYWASKKTDIFDAYVRPSVAKTRAFELIKREMENVGGHDLRVTGAGFHFFSCAYQLNETIIYHTPTKVFKIYY